jgi:hypothetical protein
MRLKLLAAFAALASFFWPCLADENSCRDAVYITTLRTSSYFSQNWESRTAISSFRLFRHHYFTNRDLIVAIVVDSPISNSRLMELSADIRQFEVQSVLYGYADPQDLTPDYQYAFRVLAKRPELCPVLFFSADTVFFKDPMERLPVDVDGAPQDVFCVPAIESEIELHARSDNLRRIADGGGARSGGPLCGTSLLYFRSADTLRHVGTAIDGLIADFTSSVTSPLHLTPRPPAVVSAAAWLDEGLARAGAAVRLLPTLESVSVVSTSCAGNHSSCDWRQDLDLVVFPAMTLPSERCMPSAPLDAAVIGSSSSSSSLSPACLGRRRMHARHREGVCAVDASDFPTDSHPVSARLFAGAVHETEHACTVLSGAVSLVPFHDYLELGSSEYANRSPPWMIGVSVEQAHEVSEFVRDSALFMQARTVFSPALVALAAASPSRAAELLDVLLRHFEGVPPQNRDAERGRLPCAVAVHLSDHGHDDLRSVCPRLAAPFRQRLLLLGLVPVDELCGSPAGRGLNNNGSQLLVALGGHCPSRHFHRLQSLLSPPLASKLRGALAGGFPPPPFPVEEPVVDPPGNLVSETPGHEFKLIENPLDERLVDLLIGRLLHHSHITQPVGANSYFIPFDGSPPRSLIERVILEHIAPLVVGTQVSLPPHGRLTGGRHCLPSIYLRRTRRGGTVSSAPSGGRSSAPRTIRRSTTWTRP